MILCTVEIFNINLIIFFYKFQASLTPHQRALINELMSEAASAINDVIHRPQMVETCVNTDLTVPPNTPSASSSTGTTFEFPANNDVTEVQISSTSSEDEDSGTPRSARPVRKRRRPVSFRKHRVAPKKVSSDADDEDTDKQNDHEENQRVSY